MQDGTRALQDFLTDLLTNAPAREKELPEKVREIRQSLADELEYDFDPPTKLTPGDAGRRCSHDETILIDRMGRAVSTIAVSLSSPKRPVKVSARLSVWRNRIWLAAIDEGEPLDASDELDALCSQLSQALQKKIRETAYDMMVDRTRHERGLDWGK